MLYNGTIDKNKRELKHTPLIIEGCFFKFMNCPFCNFDDEIKPRLLKETANFYLIPDIGNFIEGFLLIVSKEHYINLSQLEPELIKELEDLEKTAKQFLKDTYQSDILEYEHGECEMTNQKAGGCISHFHLVMVATNEDVLPEIIQDIGSGKKIKNFIDLKQLDKKMSAYLLYKKNNQIFFWENVKLLSQYMRRIIAKQDSVKFDWRRNTYPENVKQLKNKWLKWHSNNI